MHDIACLGELLANRRTQPSRPAVRLAAYLGFGLPGIGFGVEQKQPPDLCLADSRQVFQKLLEQLIQVFGLELGAKQVVKRLRLGFSHLVKGVVEREDTQKCSCSRVHWKLVYSCGSSFFNSGSST